MSSFLRSVAQKQEPVIKFNKVESPVYDDGDGDDLLFPFVYSNGVLDITYEGNNFEAEMVNNTGRAPDNDDPDRFVRILSGPRLVTSLGENFKAYIRAWRNGNIDANSPIEVYIPSQVIRVQQADREHFDEGDMDIYEISDIPPKGENYVDGSASNSYLSTYVFKTPLTFTVMEGGIKRYITFNTRFDQED